MFCTDTDECAENLDDCDPATSTCVNEPGTFRCVCRVGFMRNGSVCQGNFLTFLCKTTSNVTLKGIN